MTLAIYLVITVVVVGFFAYAVYSFLDGIWKIRDRQKADYKAYQTGLDNNLRTAGHSEEYVQKERTIRALKAKRRDAKIGYYAAWISPLARHSSSRKAPDLNCCRRCNRTAKNSRQIEAQGSSRSIAWKTPATILIRHMPVEALVVHIRMLARSLWDGSSVLGIHPLRARRVAGCSKNRLCR